MPPHGIDMSNPEVRDYIHLIRLQVLTPLSLLVNIVSTIVCGLVLDPTIGGISKFHPTSITPKNSMIGVFIIAIYIGQIGYCLLLVTASKEETKATLVKGVGISLVIANFFMGLWAVSWAFQIWLASTIFLGLMIVSLSYANIVLLIYHTPTWYRPFDLLLIHVPVRLFLLLPLNLLFWHALFITLGWFWEPGRPRDYTAYTWEGFVVVIISNLLALFVVIVRRDLVWCVGAAWLDASLWSQRPKGAPIFITSIVFTIVLPLALVVTTVYTTMKSRQRERQIQLPEDDTNGRVA